MFGSLAEYQGSLFERRENAFLQSFDRFLHRYIASLVLVAFLDGFAIEKLGLTKIETVYYIGLLFFLFLRMFFVPLTNTIRIYLLLFFLSILLGVLFTEPQLSRLAGDIKYFLRSILLFSLVLWFYSTTKAVNYNEIQKVFFYYWFLVAFLVLLHLMTGFGGVHSPGGRERGIISSYFRTMNVISFVFLLSWLNVYINNRNLYFRIITIAISLVVALLMSSKAVGLTIIILVFMHWLFYFSAKSVYIKLSLQLLAFVILCAIVLFWQEIARGVLTIFASAVPNGESVLYRMQVNDLLTVLFATRDVQVMQLMEAFSNSSLNTWFFGFGATTEMVFSTLVESDPFDILKFYGIAGFLLCYIPFIINSFFIITTKQLQMRMFAFYVFIVGAILATFIVSTVTGHIITTPTPMVVLGVIFGVWYSPRLRAQIYLFGESDSKSKVLA